ncbi:MAG: alpha/beta hydrolase-fold protein [Gemmataceae bacterium]
MKLQRTLIVVGTAVTLFWSFALARVVEAPRLVVQVGKGLLPAPVDGRMLVFLRPVRLGFKPDTLIGSGGPFDLETAILGADGNALTSGSKVMLDDRCATFPQARLADLPRGDYYAQAVFDFNRDLRLANAPGNLISPVARIKLPPEGGAVEMTLTEALPEERLPRDTETLRFIRLRSEKLSKFHGRPIYLRAGVILPPGHAREPDRRYPLRVQIGGFGTRFNVVERMMHPGSSFQRAWTAADTPRMILLHLDGAGPLGDPYQVNSANHGPYGDAIVEELIPHVEQRFRGMGQGWARFTEGHSTGGWVSLALQVFYPDFFGGTWSHAPDPVDFRAFELVNIYEDANFYVNRSGYERAACRTIQGDTVYSIRREVQHETVLGRGGNWTLSGKDWASWNATFGPRGADGLPTALWDGKTGVINRAVLDHWKRYDLRLHLQSNWEKLAPRLQGKLRIWVGEADDYFLNNAVHLLDQFLSRARPASGASITYGPRRGHSWRGLTERDILVQMGAAMEKAQPRR